MRPHCSRHRIGILALDGFVPFDCSVPYEMFSMATAADGKEAYEISFVGDKKAVASEQFNITRILSLSSMQDMDTIIIPGIVQPFSFNNPSVLEALGHAYSAGVRLASICTGACILAAAGLLNGISATTHWALVKELAARYPLVKVEPDILYCDNGQILTSAGLSSGIDLCLHMVRKDLGATAAERLATLFVVPIERDGGHRQFIRHAAPDSDGSLSALLLWLQENMHRNLTVRRICREAHMSARTLNRKFQEQTGVPPMAWLTMARIRRSQVLLESSALSVEEIASITGFGSATSLREHFRRIVGTSPTAWRKTHAVCPTEPNRPQASSAALPPPGLLRSR